MDLIAVTTAREAAERDAEAINSGIPSRALMQRAGAAAAGEIARRFPELLRVTVGILAGPGNNGGDAWVVARALAAVGVRVVVTAAGEARTESARAERALAAERVEMGDATSAPLIIDGLLGTGTRGAPQGGIADAIAAVNAARDAGALVVSLDVPSGLDAEGGGAEHAVRAHLTLTFGTLKRGLLVARGNAGRIAVLDIGLGRFGDTDGAPRLVTGRWVRAVVPGIAAAAHKGTRRKLVIVGGQLGMAGAPILAARAAMRSGIGMVRVLVARENVPVVQAAAPEALARAWPTDRAGEIDDAVRGWADGVLLGPGLGDGPEQRALVERVLESWRGPVVIDADGLNVFKGDAPALAALLGGRPALLTPHAGELARLAATTTDDVLAHRFEIGAETARATGAAVLLKGVPTVITAVDGRRLISAAGTPVLATAGSGDVLGGLAATLVTQMEDGLVAGACAAWIHGRAAELAGAGRVVRGTTLDDVERALAEVWSDEPEPPTYPVLAELPPVGDA